MLPVWRLLDLCLITAYLTLSGMILMCIIKVVMDLIFSLVSSALTLAEKLVIAESNVIYSQIDLSI